MARPCVVGVDPGLTRCGVGVVAIDERQDLRPLAVDVIRTSAESEISLRLLAVSQGVGKILDRFKPAAVAIERVFTQHNKGTAAGTAMAAGVAAVEAARRGIPVTFYTPSQIKSSVSGNGKADKAQVTTMVTRILGLAKEPKPADAADALAIAICHLWCTPLQERLRTSTKQDPVGIVKPKHGKDHE
ncbi:MAG: crossover junction endodeoxyribonuclease RuvC [Lawsonella sp.]